MNEERKHQLITAVLTGQANADEIHDLRAWMAEAGENRAEFEEWQEIWNGVHLPLHTSNIDELYSRAKEQIKDERHGTGKSHSTRGWLRYAAVLLVLCGFAAIFYFVVTTQRADTVPAQVHEIVKENPAGLKTRFTLPDGSRVAMNSESRLVFNNYYGRTNRHVALEGEAYFDVARDSSLSFEVSVAGQVIRALGTAFNVRAFTGDNMLEVMLVEGKVDVRSINATPDTQLVALSAGEQLTKDIINGKTIKAPLNSQDIAWKDGVINFKSASFGEVVATLSRWYGVKFVVDEPVLADWDYTGQFSNESLENVMHSIGYSKRLNYSIDNKTVYVSPKP